MGAEAVGVEAEASSCYKGQNSCTLLDLVR